jgi:crotonobetainyl-CoA:carnitine CoA-transferase CaiB-like acyl-CoA transferase
VREVLADPQLAHREALAEVIDAGGSFRVMNPPFRMSGATVRAGGFAAALGEHTRDVLRQAGYSEAQIDDFAASRVIGAA